MRFIDNLKQWCNTEKGPYRRPFTPNPKWEKADVMVVGTNPATPMRDQFDSFEQYWQSLTTKPDLFYERYRAVHKGKSSKTTNNANILLDLLKPLNVLVTNIVWYPVERKKDIPKEEWEFGKKALRDLFNHVRPKAVFCHGADAQKFAKSLNSDADRYQPASKQAEDRGSKLLVFTYHHFSGQGLKKGTKFQPTMELPVFAEAMHSHIVRLTSQSR